MRSLFWFSVGLISALLLPGLALLLVLEANFHRLRPDASDLQKAAPKVDMKEFEPWESQESSWVEVQVQWAASELEVERQACVPWVYGMMLPVPIKPDEWAQDWSHWHETYS